MTWSHGWTGLFIPYAVTAAGVLAGLLFVQAPAQRILRFPAIAIPAFIAAALIWGVLKNTLDPRSGNPARSPGADYLLLFLGLAFCFLTGGVAGKLAARTPNRADHQRGTVLEAASEQRRANESDEIDRLTLAGLPIDSSDETKHFKLIGTTGTGKSAAIRGLLAGALARGDRAVIADPDGSYLDRLHDPARGDQILNPFDARAARWNLFAEMRTAHDADQLARSLIPDGEGPEKNWRGYARVFLGSVLRQLHRIKHDEPLELYQLLAVTPVEELRELLSDTPAGPYLAQDNGKFFGAVRAVANTHLTALEHIALQASDERLSVRSWIANPSGRAGGVLFLPYKANEIATLKGLISTWMRLAIFETMSRGECNQRLWFVIDELDALGAIDGLKDALARLRKFGGRCVLGFQSIAQVSGTYGHAEAQTIVENCGNTLILRCSASEGGGTAHFASKLIGEREVVRLQSTKSRRRTEWFGSRSIAEHYVTESAVLASEIEQLPDLQGFLKFASTPTWRRVNLRIS